MERQADQSVTGTNDPTTILKMMGFVAGNGDGWIFLAKDARGRVQLT
jgi:hypothetical protein